MYVRQSPCCVSRVSQRTLCSPLSAPRARRVSFPCSVFTNNSYLYRCRPVCSSVCYVPRMKRNGHARIPSGLKDSLLFHLDAVLRIVNLRAEALLQETLELGLRESLII